MTDYERPAFKQEWWDKVETFLKENPQVGFETDDVKEFVKFCVNRKMQEIDKDLEELRKMADDLGSD